MKFSSLAVTSVVISSATAFSPVAPSSLSRAASTATPTSTHHPSSCSCPSCVSSLVLFADATPAAEVPVEVEALDGIESDEEAHNADRPARKSLKKKGPRGKPLSEFSAGDTVQARVKALASYGAFLDIGAQTDGLLHISQLSVDYVSDVKDVLEVGQEVDVRITNIDEKKNQVALTLLTVEQEEEAKEAASQPRRQQRERAPRQQRRDDSALLAKVVEKGWDVATFVEGNVVSTVDFGCFVRVDASLLNSEVEGELDGLVHISALSTGRVDAVTSVVNVGDKVQVRVKDISNNKVSLSMVSVEDEQAKFEARGGGGRDQPVGNKNWKEDLGKLTDNMPTFQNRPQVVDLRK